MCLQNSTWHLRRRIVRDKIISQKWNKNKLPDKKVFGVVLCGIVGHKLNFWLNSFRLQNRNARPECTIRQSLYPWKPHIYRTIVQWPTACYLQAWDQRHFWLNKIYQGFSFWHQQRKKQNWHTFTDGNKNFPFRHYLYTSADLILFPFLCRLLPCRGEIRNARHHVPGAARCLDSLPYSLSNDPTQARRSFSEITDVLSTGRQRKIFILSW